jgi:hypothetical protein
VKQLSVFPYAVMKNIYFFKNYLLRIYGRRPSKGQRPSPT